MKWARGTIEKLKGNKRAITGMVKDARTYYNNLCPSCKRMVLVKTKYKKPIRERHYCLECQKMAKEMFGDKYES